MYRGRVSRCVERSVAQRCGSRAEHAERVVIGKCEHACGVAWTPVWLAPNHRDPLRLGRAGDETRKLINRVEKLFGRFASASTTVYARAPACVGRAFGLTRSRMIASAAGQRSASSSGISPNAMIQRPARASDSL